jgi:MFS family permease
VDNDRNSARVSELSADEARSLRRDWNLFTALTFLFSFGFAIYSGVFQNFLRDQMGAGPLQLGTLESLREIPGFLTALLTGTLVALAESRVAGLGLLIGGVGIGLTGQMPNFALLIAITVFWSVGFHLYAGMSPAITVMLSKGEESGRHLGRMGAVSSVATLAGLGVSWLAKQIMPGIPYNAFFFTAGICIVASGLLCMALGKHAASHGPRARLILRREYSLFYLLTFLEGCRRQIFSIFASFALIVVYKVPLRDMLTLQLVNAVLIAITAPQIGRLVDRKGERGPLIFYTIGLILVFAGYATTRNVAVLYVLFLLDNVLFSFGVGFTTYLNRIVRKGELTPCVAMGTTMNHIAAVTVPIGGALLWDRLDNYQIPFYVGVAIAIVSFFATQRLPHGPVVKPVEAGTKEAVA